MEKINYNVLFWWTVDGGNEDEEAEEEAGGLDDGSEGTVTPERYPVLIERGCSPWIISLR